MGKTTAHEEDVLNTARTVALAAWTPFVALFTVAPTDAGGGTEVTGGGYARQACGFGAPSGTPRAMANAAEILITMPAATVVAVGVFDAVSAGELKYWVAITSKAFDASDQARFAAGALTVQED